MAEPSDVVVVFVHGINTTCQDYYERMRNKLLRALPKPDRLKVIFRAVFWADIVRGRQQEYLQYASSRSEFRVSDLHKLVIEGLGDAASYQKTRRRENSAYYDIQARMTKTLRDVSLGPQDTRPLVFIGHSLGCHIISSYAWDLHKLKHLASRSDPTDLDEETLKRLEETRSASPLEKLDTFAGFVTMGSNMPLFTFTFGPQHVYPITRPHHEEALPAFPGPALDPRLHAQARWLNFFSSNDPLGYPLKPLNDAYDDEERLTDIHTCSEGWMRALLLRGKLRQLAAMRAHQGYWTNRTVVRDTARLLSDLIHAAERAVASDKQQPTVRPRDTVTEEGRVLARESPSPASG